MVSRVGVANSSPQASQRATPSISRISRLASSASVPLATSGKQKATASGATPDSFPISSVTRRTLRPSAASATRSTMLDAMANSCIAPPQQMRAIATMGRIAFMPRSPRPRRRRPSRDREIRRHISCPRPPCARPSSVWLVTMDGYTVTPSILVPANATNLAISQTGVVTVTLPGQATPQQLGQLTIANFINDAGLQALGGNYFQQTEASGQPTVCVPGDTAFGILQQGYIEASNVDPVAEITNLFAAQRAYEMNSKVIQAADQMSGTISNLRG